MKKVFGWIGYVLLFVLLVALFLPKKELYFGAERLLQKHRIIVSDEKIQENPIALVVTDGNFYVKGLLVGSFQKLSFYPDLLFNTVRLEHFHKNRSISIIPNISIDSLDLFYTPLYPIKLFIQGEGSFGKVEGSVDLWHKKGVVELFGEPKNLGKFVKLKKIKEGHYRYEFSY